MKTLCAAMMMLAQSHANDMARRDQLDHAGFERRAQYGARAENVAVGCKTQTCAYQVWAASPPHARNMHLPGCRAVASALSHSGKRYWVMEISQDDKPGRHK